MRRLTGSNRAGVLSLMEVLSLASSGIKPVTFPLWDHQATTPPPRPISLTHTLPHTLPHILNWSQLQCIAVRLLGVIPGLHRSLALHLFATAVSTLSHSLMMHGTHIYTVYIPYTHTHAPFVSHAHKYGDSCNREVSPRLCFTKITSYNGCFCVCACGIMYGFVMWTGNKKIGYILFVCSKLTGVVSSQFVGNDSYLLFQ